MPKGITKRAVDFEQEVFNLFKRYLSKDETVSFAPRVVLNDGTFNIFDMLLPEGCKILDLKGPLFIECKYSIRPDSTKYYTRLFEDFSSKKKDANFLIVFNDQGQPIQKYEGENLHIHFISFSELNQKLIEKSGNKEESELIGSWQERTQKNKKDLKNLLDEKVCTPILGAGVSIDAKVPSWEQLLRQLLQKAKNYSKEDVEAHYKFLSDRYENSLLIIARIIDGYLKDPEEKILLMADILYHKDIKKSELIKELANVIKDKGIKDVITFNYDTLLEDELDPEHKSEISIYNKTRAPKNNVAVYHVHGIIKNNDKFRDKNIKLADKDYTRPVLSENEYHELYGDANSWSNIKILNALYHTHCFLVGLSMTDPNLRRLLDVAKKNQSADMPHFVFLGRFDNIDEEYYDTQEILMNKLGLKVIWYTTEKKKTGVPGKTWTDYSNLTKAISELKKPEFKSEDSPK